MRAVGLLRVSAFVALLAGAATTVAAQEPETETREALVKVNQAEKGQALQPYVPTATERLMPGSKTCSSTAR